MFEWNLPKIFWGDSILMLTFIINSLRSNVLGWKTPFELLYNKKPDFSCLEIFECLCYTTITQHIKISLLHVHIDVFSLDIVLDERHLKYMILTILGLFYLDMLYFMKITLPIKTHNIVPVPCIFVNDDIHLKEFSESPIDHEVLADASHNCSPITFLILTIIR